MSKIMSKDQVLNEIAELRKIALRERNLAYADGDSASDYYDGARYAFNLALRLVRKIEDN